MVMDKWSILLFFFFNYFFSAERSQFPSESNGRRVEKAACV